MQTLGAIVLCLLVFMGVTHCIGHEKGESLTYEPAKIEAVEQYEAQLESLQAQIAQVTSDYNKKIASLKTSQAREKAGLQSAHEADIKNLLAQHETEIVETRDSNYLKGQVEARADMQRQIDSKARVEKGQNDWNAPVFGIRK